MACSSNIETLHGRVRLCRLSAYTGRLMPVDLAAVRSAWLNPPGAHAPWKTVWEPARLQGSFLPLTPVVLANPRFFFRIAMTAVRDLVALALRPRDFEKAVQPGDMVAALGAAWGVPGYARRIAAAKRRYGIRFAVLVSDMIPIENGELVERCHALQFRQWLNEIGPNADVILTVSKYSRQALMQFAAAAGWPKPRIDVIRLGGEWSPRPGAHRAGRGADAKVDLPEHYVLFVSTIEIRKNHRLLVRVWRRLIERHGAGAVPVLVFAGQVGWMVDDLLADLAASDWLGGMIEHKPRLSDAALTEAYDRCLFTVFPSLCEGWGLPVAESLAHGKFCLASNRTSIPEVGGDLIDYFDPADDDEAVGKIERLLFEPGHLAAREARLCAKYRPGTRAAGTRASGTLAAGTWSDCARSVVLKLERHAAIAHVLTDHATTDGAATAGDPHERLASPQPVGNP